MNITALVWLDTLFRYAGAVLTARWISAGQASSRHNFFGDHFAPNLTTGLHCEDEATVLRQRNLSTQSQT